MISRLQKTALCLAVVAALFATGCGSSRDSMSGYQQTRIAALDTISAGRFDGGRMWTFDYPPLDYFQEAYGFRPDQTWMDDVRMSALRFASYCSASFVSGDGLVMTNHHCARESVEGVSEKEENLVDKGFWAGTLDDERKVPGLYVEQLVNIKDVTDEVISAMESQKTDDEKVAARKKTIEEIEKREAEQSKLRAQVVTLYNGGKYSVYLYKRYDDVRLVFAPELQLGYFGGDPDNFTYPRYTFDCSFFRVYGEDGKPLKTDHFFRWSAKGAEEDEVTFVIGNPARTGRLSTTAQLEFNRDIQYPFISRMLDDRVAVLQNYAENHPEKREEMINQIFGISNSQKAYKGQLNGLRDDALMARRRAFDRSFRSAINARSDLKVKYGHIWDEISESRSKVRAVAPDLYSLRAGGFGSEHYSKAMGLVRYAMELKEPEEKRSKPYQGTTLNLTKRALQKKLSPEMDMEVMNLSNQLRLMQDWLGAQDPIVRLALGVQSPDQAARRLIEESVLTDSSMLVQMVEDGPAAIEQSKDPFIRIARLAYPRFDAAQKVSDEVRTRDQVNQTLLGRALFDVYGTSIPPDATFTLRLADGVVKGYEYNGTVAPPYTTFYGMYDRYYSFKSRSEWGLPERWVKPPPEFNLSTPLNFISTNDIIGGNSGSPMINRSKEIVGLIFDGNIESLPGEYIFAEDANNRSVSVHSRGMLEGLKHIYKAKRLADELTAGKMIR